MVQRGRRNGVIAVPIVTEEEHERRLSYYRQGLTDAEIGKHVDRSRGAIGDWRRTQGLPFNPSPSVGEGQRLSPEKDEERMTLYSRGLFDGQMAKEVGVARSTIVAWRKSKGLPSHRPVKTPVPLTDDEKEKIRMLHGEDTTIYGIAKELERSFLVVSNFCKREGLDTSMERSQGIRRWRKREKVIEYLSKNGPTKRSDLAEQVMVASSTLSGYMMDLVDMVDTLRFRAGRRAHILYGDLHNITVYSLKDDPRIIDFIVDRLKFVPTTPTEAGWATRCLREQIGTERAREVVSRLGYGYGEDRSGTSGSWVKFTNDEFRIHYDRGLNDAEISRELNVTSGAVAKRRRKLNLPPNWGVPKKYTDEEFKSLYKLKLNDVVMSRLLGVSPGSVAHRRSKFGLPPWGRMKEK